MAHLHISINDFYDMTPKEFHLAMEAFREYHQTEAEVRSREVYDAARFNAWLIVKHKFKPVLESPQELVTFKWEEGMKKEQQSMEDMKQTMLSIALAHNAGLKQKGK